MSFRIFLLLFPAFLLLSGCIPYEEKKLVEINLDLQDPELQKLYDFQDQQLTDSLLAYFRHPDPGYRYAAAMAFGSIKGEIADEVIDSLSNLLKDDITGVRLGAAYALGQLGSPRPEKELITAFQDTLINSTYLRKTILEAVGKSASAEFLPALSSIATYLRTDTLLLEGQAYGIYRYALRDIVSRQGTAQMASFLIKKNYPASVRLIAANYLQRAKNIAVDTFALDLLKEFKREKDVNTRMALAIGLGKSKLPEVGQALIDYYPQAKDYRVKCNIIRAFSNFDYATVRPVVMSALDDPNFHVANTAAAFLLTSGSPQDANVYWQKARQDSTLFWQTKTTLYAAANKHLPYYFEVTKGRINQELRNLFVNSSNPYEQGAALNAMAEFGWNYRYIKEQGFASISPVVRTASVEALAKIAANPNFNTFFGLGSRKVKKELAEYFAEAIQTKDPGMVAEAANALSNPNLDFKSSVEDFSYLTTVKDDLRLPKEIESYNSLEKAIAYFNDRPFKPRQPEFNHPTDWRIVNEVTANTRAVISMGEKEIELEFFPQAAPATVANFVQLARSGYFNGKNFHRVIANFVAQGGCSRGDGYGGLNYSIRSELPQMYYNDEGFVGMASAGNHTESTQFFITFSPTMHLDGNYTIFAKVTDGMDQVHQVKIGDVIDKVVIN